ncbi:MAG: NAD-dependent epimerase/dehydratase family protein [Gammaproteobacteria bacterium]|nr:NAD-dependent epimerase/dehydratase family protein [Gammaproteobacteria bacterium]
MANTIKKALITGGNGNLGRLVADQLLAKNIEVVKFDIPGTEPEETQNGETIIIGDIRDKDQLRDILNTHQPDTVYHLASLLSGSSEADLDAAWEINASASYHLLRLAQEFKVRTFFFASTIATFGNDLADPMPEDTQQWPENIYGATKVAVERLGVYFKLKHGMDFRCLRFPLVFSPFAPPSAVTAYPSHAFRAACANESFTFPVSPGIGMSSMLLEDVITGIIKFTEADQSQLTRHVYSLHGYYVTARQVAEEIQSRVPGFSYDFKPQPTVDALLDAWPNVITDQSARDDWGWSPEYDFKKSADQMMAFFGG